MKNLFAVSLICLASTAATVAHAAETSKNTAPVPAEPAWRDSSAAPWQLRDTSLPASIKVSEVGIFPSLNAPTSLPQPLAEAGAARTLMAPATALATNKDVGLSSFLAYLNLPQASYAFPSQADSGSAGANRAKTELAGKFEAAKSIAEPASEVLMLGALAALAIAVRRRMPNERF